MKITEVAADGLGVSALIAAAGAVHDQLDDRGVTLAMIETEGEGGQPWTPVLMAAKDNGRGLPLLVVTVERNPRILRLVADEIDEAFAGGE